MLQWLHVLQFLPGSTPLAVASELEFEPVLAAIQSVESAGRPWVIRDNATGQAVELPDRQGAEAAAAVRLQLGHNLDLGLYQINSVHLRRPGVNLATVFDPGVQQSLARTILAEFLQRARAIYGNTELAWERAIGAYNDGQVESDNEPYVTRVLRVLGRVPLIRPAVPDDRSVLAASPIAAASIDPAADPVWSFDAPRRRREQAARLGQNDNPGAGASDGSFADPDALLVALAVALGTVVLAGCCGAAVAFKSLSIAALASARALARALPRRAIGRALS
jgi:hypothetical protein